MFFRLFSYITLGEDSLRIEKLGNQKFLIFVNSSYLANISVDKEAVIELVKSLLLKLRYRLFLRGFYKVKVYLHSKLGFFIELVQLEDTDYYGLDFRVLVYLDEKFYFKTQNYFSLPDCDKYYMDGYYYCDADNIPNINEVVEFGSFIYGKDLNSIMFRWKKC